MYSTAMQVSKDLVAASAAPLILSILQDGESYGYAILQRVRDLSGGELAWTDGMLYPVLHRLEKQGAVSSRWRESPTGRKRKYYTLKTQGRKTLADHQAQWKVVNSALAALWS
jgi:PadR family transcriptional regulator PadR